MSLINYNNYNDLASNAISQQFSPFISEDDSSEINDISPSPIGICGKYYFVFLYNNYFNF
jgi:hypothetical protein